MEAQQERVSALLCACTFVSILCWLIVFSRGHGTSVDEGHVYETARALVERRSWRLEEPLNERYYSRYSPFPSVLAAALYAAGRALGGTTTAQVWAYQLNAVATAAGAVCLMLAASRLGATRGAAVFVAFSYGLASLAAPYAGSLYVQPLAAGLVAACVALSCGASGAPLAVCWALAVWCREELVLLAPAFACFAALVSGKTARAWAFYGWGTVTGIALWGLTNFLRGDPVLVGSYGEEGFVGDVTRGIYGLAASAGKGLLFFSPLSALGLFAAMAYRPLWWRPLLAAVLAYGLLIAGWWTWHGGYCWGPRLLLPVLPVLHLALAQLWDRGVGLRRTWLVLLAVLACFQLALSGAHPYEERVGSRSGLATESEHLFVPSLSPLWVPHRAVGDWWWAAPRTDSGQSVVLLIVGGLILLGSVSLYQPGRELLRSCKGANAGRVWAGWRGLGGVLLVLGIGWGAVLNGFAGLVSKLPDRAATVTVFAPVRGVYTFHLPRLASGEAAQVVVDGRLVRPVLRGAWADYVVELVRGEHRLRFTAPLSVREVFWTSPGGVFYKESVPNLYLGRSEEEPLLRVLREARRWGWGLIVVGIYLLFWPLANQRDRHGP